jgi:uncharacterized membrane protein (UPF0127 family)
MSRNTIIFFFIIVILIGIIALLFGKIGVLGSKTAIIKDKTISLEIADSPEELQKGLSQRDSLSKDSGMLFIFDKSEKYQFWMKDMRFPIDIIYLNNEKVVTIFANVPHQIDNVPNLNLYEPKSPANRVLELNAGKAKELGVKEGDTIKINL